MKSRKFQVEIGKKFLEVEIRQLAEQASGSCLIRYGETLVLATVVMSDTEREGIDYFPLVVDYEERYYAAGKILGSRYVRREGRPSEGAVLTSRLIDRAIRPLFPEDLRRDVQVIITCLSWDEENDPDVLGLIAASVSLLISDIPWMGPITSLRIGRLNGNFVLNPTYSEREESNLDLVLSAVKTESGLLINMMEAESKEVDESVISEAISFAKPTLERLIDFQNKISKDIGKKKKVVEAPKINPGLEKEIKKILENKLQAALFQSGKKERVESLNLLLKEILTLTEEKYTETENTFLIKSMFDKEIKKLVHESVISKERRVDGRKINQIRDIHCEVGLLPRTHGSGLFSRGETRALSILTLGAPGDVKLMEEMEIVGKKRFIHHYNFPPYSVGEVRPIRGPGRREIGHGALAERALNPVVPDVDNFPYTIRIVSEMLSSNGSTSMASICGSSLALMDAGVPIERPVAGVALGLMMDDKNYKILTDIQGPEDSFGDMDLKVAGTKQGITVIQLDVKIIGITEQLLKEALIKAKRARFSILKEITKVLAKPRAKLSPLAPQILTLQISPEKIGNVIGPGGNMINAIIEECGVTIDIEDSGKVFVTSDSEEAAKKAVTRIKNIARELKPGEVFQGKVKKVSDFGAFVELFPGKEGLIHISKLSRERVRRVEDVVNTGDIVQVKVISVDEQGRINLSLLKVIKKRDGQKRERK